MNFFKLYIGDYQRDTAHLSVTEHGAYLLMLQHYYATEKPLPIGKALHRMLRAQDKAERDAIDSVASQFWTVTDAGLVNERADEEITKAGAQADTNARIAREREAKRKAAREQHEQSTNRATNGQPNQTPDTRHQTTTTPPTTARVRVSDIEVFPIEPDWQPSEAFATTAKLSGLVIADDLRALGIAEFVAYWRTRPTDMRNQAEWEHALVKSLKHFAAQAKQPTQTTTKPGRKGSHTGFENIDYTAGVLPDGRLA